MTYIIQSTKLSQDFINDVILTSLIVIGEHNQMITDYWLDQLYDEDGRRNNKNWNEENMNEIREDAQRLKSQHYG